MPDTTKDAGIPGRGALLRPFLVRAMAQDRTLRLTRRCLDRMLAHAREAAPEECCGLLAGDGVVATVIYPLENELHSPVAYSAAPSSLVRAFRDMRERGLTLMAIYHSHPTSPAVPSRTDLAQNYYGELPRPIISLITDPPTVRCFVMGPDDWAEIPLEVVDDMDATNNHVAGA